MDNLEAYRADIEQGGTVDEIARRIMRRASLPAATLPSLREAVETHLRTPTQSPADDPPPEPAPLYPPPPTEAPQAEPATLTLPNLAPIARQEPPMHASPELGAALLRALPTALSLYQIAHDSGAIDEIADAIGGAAKRAARLAKRGPLTDDTLTDLRREACAEVRCVLPEITDEALEEIGGLIIDAIDERTNTGPLDELDGPAAKRGLASLLDKLDLWSRDSGNLEALARKARREAARAEREADRIDRIIVRQRARG